MKDASHADSVLNWLKGTTFPAAPGTVYVAIIGGVGGTPGFVPSDKSTWSELSTTVCTDTTRGNYARTAITFGSITTINSVRSMAGATIGGAGSTFRFPDFTADVEIDGVVICSHPTNALSSCGLRACDAPLNVAYGEGSYIELVPANVIVTEH